MGWPTEVPSRSRRPEAVPSLRLMDATGALVMMWAPASRAAKARRCVTVPMPPRTTIHVPSDPGSLHYWAPANPSSLTLGSIH
jgi:hypothetical protein